jgi:Zn-finger nucleic acid-binding protein
LPKYRAAAISPIEAARPPSAEPEEVSVNCPRCTISVLDQRDRDGVTIDICNQCRGIWLDRGELEKLVAYAAREVEEYSRERRHRDDDYDGPPSSDRHRGRHGPARKRRWFETLGDLFD